MNRAIIEADPVQRGGHALIRIIGGAAAGLADPRFRISREGYQAAHLGPDGWQIAEALLAPLVARRESTDLVLSVGPQVVDLVEAGVVMLAVPSAGFDDAVSWPELPLSRARKSGFSVAAPVVLQDTPVALQDQQRIGPPASVEPPTVAAAPVKPVATTPAPMAMPPPPPPPRPQPDTPPPQLKPVAATPTPTAVPPPPAPPRPQPDTPPPMMQAMPAQPRTGGRGVILGVVLGMLVVAAALGAWWMFARPQPTPIAAPAPAVAPPPRTAATPPTAAAPASSMPAPAQPPVAARDCSEGSVADTVGCAANADALFDIGRQKWDAGQSDEGLVLMQIAADRGSGSAALKLAQIYDPNGFHAGGPISRPNARQAAQYYRKAIQAHQNAADAPREALRQRLQHDADQGDALAGLTLKDFWP